MTTHTKLLRWQLHPRYRWRLILGGAFLVLFSHAAFQPFQMSMYNLSTKVGVLSAYTIITFLLLAFNLLLLYPRLERKIDFQKTPFLYAWIGWNILSIGVGFFLFKVAFGFYPMSIERVITGLLAVTAVGIVPLAMLRFLKYSESKLGVAEKPSTQRSIKFTATSGNRHLDLLPEQILCVEAQRNYVMIYFLVEGKTKEQRLRLSLKQAKEQLNEFDDFIECHRAFIVNRTALANMERSGYNHVLRFKSSELVVPLSRSKLDVFRSYFSGQ